MRPTSTSLAIVHEQPLPLSAHPRGEWAVGVVAAAWLLAVVAGFAAWEVYDTTPGPRGEGSTAAGDPAGPPWTLTLYAHPHCPCVRATLAELADLARAGGDQLGVEVVFVRPEGVEPGWERTPAWDAAAAIPGARVGCDPDGAEATRAGAATSGHAVLADRTGRVAFRGGLTRARGRVGDSPGRRAVLEVVAGGGAAAECPVFGCPLLDGSR